MARNGDSKIVCRTRAGDRPKRGRRSDPSSKFAVRECLADRNFLKRLPNTLLKGRTTHVKGKFQADAGCLHEADHLSDQGFVFAIGANELSSWKAILKISNQLIWVVSEQDRGDAPAAGGNQDCAKRRLPD